VKLRRFKKSRTNVVNDGNGDLFADCHNVLKGPKNYFSQFLNIHWVSDVRQMEILVHKAKPSVPEPSLFQFKNVVKLKSYKFPGTDQIPAISYLSRR
jgi:hypothetical protein